jgi:hypothetical protein
MPVLHAKVQCQVSINARYTFTQSQEKMATWKCRYSLDLTRWCYFIPRIDSTVGDAGTFSQRQESIQVCVLTHLMPVLSVMIQVGASAGTLSGTCSSFQCNQSKIWDKIRCKDSSKIRCTRSGYLILLLHVQFLCRQVDTNWCQYFFPLVEPVFIH